MGSAESSDEVVILGAGVSGLAAGYRSGARIYEASSRPGGICASYSLSPSDRGNSQAQPGTDCYRFEVGGGHWIWGGDPLVLRFIESFGRLRSYERRAAVYFPDTEVLVPYPLQTHLSYLDRAVALEALRDLVSAGTRDHSVETMSEWMQASFGPTLCKLFFRPFHELYTAGLADEIAPQDGAKSPVDLSAAIQGALDDPPPAGYNTSFLYPEDSLAGVAAGMAKGCSIEYGKRVARIDTGLRRLYFADESEAQYGTLLSTLPLNRMLELTSLEVGHEPDPFTSVLVVNIGARRGDRCPDVHWTYVPRASSGFHRVGFYSNVDDDFLPVSLRGQGTHVAAYVERAFRGGGVPSDAERDEIAGRVCAELTEWGWIGEVDVVDPTWVEVAYTWSRPGSRWREAALTALQAKGIYQVGRYGRWAHSVRDQGLAHSIRDGLMAGAALSGRA
jgi:protoporphyrinogen oxidase